MFNLYKRLREAEEAIDTLNILMIKEVTKREALEDYLGVEFFQGHKMRAHYRKKKTLVKKVGRPKGSKNKREREVIVVV